MFTKLNTLVTTYEVDTKVRFATLISYLKCQRSLPNFSRSISNLHFLPHLGKQRISFHTYCNKLYSISQSSFPSLYQDMCSLLNYYHSTQQVTHSAASNQTSTFRNWPLEQSDLKLKGVQSELRRPGKQADNRLITLDSAVHTKFWFVGTISGKRGEARQGRHSTDSALQTLYSLRT